MFALTLLAILTGTLCLWLLKYWWTNRNFFHYAKMIPQVPGHWPLLGHLPFVMGASAKELYLNHKASTSPGPSPRKFWMGHILMVVVDDPDQLQQVLTSKLCVDKPKFYETLLFNKGLLLSNGNLWRTHRKLCDPAFNLHIIKSFLPIFNEKSRVLTKCLRENVNGAEFNIFDYLAPLSLDNILSTSTGLKTDIQTDRNHEFLEHIFQALHIFSTKILNVWLQNKFIFRMTETYKLEQKHVVNGLTKTANEVITQKQKAFESGTSSDDLESGKPQIFIDQLFKKRDVFTNEEISDEVNTIIITGFETVSNTLSTVTLLLALYPEVQDKIFEELQQVFSSQDEEVTNETLDQLNYMDMVIKETMRFWPAVPYVARHLSKDMEIGSCIVPAGANIVAPIIHVHRDKKLWGEDADKFRPERFSKEEFSKIHSFAYLPFSRGPRNCIGYRYAMHSMKVAMAHIFRHYRITTSMKIDEVEFEFVIVSKVAQGYNVSLEKRQFQNR